jgi:alpha-N-acetylglucosamine transferase
MTPVGPSPAPPPLHSAAPAHDAPGASTSGASSPTSVLPPPAAAAVRFTYATLLTRESYLPGALALARSLAAFGARHPLLVLLTPSALPPAAAALAAEPGVAPRAVAPYRPPPAARADHSAYKVAAYLDCWTKLRMWELDEEYDIIVYLDSDMLVRRPLDHLFRLPRGGGGDALYAAPDCATGRPRAAERAACALFGAAGARPSYFNAGLFVMEPAAARLREFDALLASRAVEIGGYAEQDFLNAVYHDTWRPLPPTYNLQKSIKAHHPELWVPDTAHVWHFTDRKPWDAHDHEENAPF